MKRLLILAYDFPPYVSVAALRPYYWFHRLHEFGIYPIVVTRQWANDYGDERDYVAPGKTSQTIVEESENGTIIRTPYKPNIANRLFLKYQNTRFPLLRRIITAYYEFAQFLFFIGPKSGLYWGAKEYLEKNQVDVIIATGDPFVLFRYASKLSRKHHIPWIADYRDPWSARSYAKGLGQLWNNYFERKIVNTATCAITVSDYCVKVIEQLVKRPIHVVSNGYNEELTDIYANQEQTNNGILRFAYVGTIYKYHPIESVLFSFNEFARSDNKPKFELNFFGINNREEIEQLLVTKYTDLAKHVTIYPRMSNTKVLEQLSEHHVMVLLNNYYSTGTKIYDYMAIKRYILFCYTHDSEAESLRQKYYLDPVFEGMSDCLQADIINKTSSGIVVRDKQHLLNVLNSLYNEFLQIGKIACNSNGCDEFSRYKQTEKFAKIVHTL